MNETAGFHPMQMVVRFAPHFKLRLGEYLASAILFSMGLVLAIWPEILDRGGIFTTMRELGRGEVWAFSLLLLAIPRLCALYVNGRRSITPYIRLGFSFISVFAWWQITLSLFLSGVPALIWGVFPWLLALEFFNIFMSAADTRDVIDKKRTANDGSRKV